MKLNKQRCGIDIRKYYITNRVVDIWNDLPESVVSANTMVTLERFTRECSICQHDGYIGTIYQRV
jgi:hypothetical protein